MSAMTAFDGASSRSFGWMWINGTRRLPPALRERDTDGAAEYVAVLPRLVVTCRLSRSHLLESPHTANDWRPPSDRKSTW